MTSAEIARLFRARRAGHGKWMAKCPHHRERTASLSITDMGAGRTRLHCFAGCAQRDVLKAAGLSWKELKPGSVDSPRIRHRMTDERKLEKLLRQYGLALWLLSAEPGRSRYWEAALRRMVGEMEPLYWCLMPDWEKFRRMRGVDEKDYWEKRMDWLNDAPRIADFIDTWE